mmetsp:Transcript_129716/g.361291  ORF Transcript_129716/g.361291 Transcript_129716/m.361291 type:complete len:390 (-) Transcript_129716:96-1265(-)
MAPWILLTTVVLLGSWMLHRTDVFWCQARSIPLGVFWRGQGFSVKDIPNLHGRTALVTGANTGLGFEVALQLALANATVLLACRDMAKCGAASQQVSSAVQAHGSHGAARPVYLDLANLEQVAAAADVLLRNLPRLDILVNNAGVATQFPHSLTVDGVETTFQINYLGHFLLTRSLLPLLQSPGHPTPARVVHLTSGAHRGAPNEGILLSREGINSRTAMGPYARYGMAKLANLVFAEELSRRAPAVLSNAVHPGVVATHLLREDNFRAMLGGGLGALAFRLARWRNTLFAYSPATAAATVLHCAASPELERVPVRGALFVPVAKRWPPRHHKAGDAAFGAALWRFSEQLVAEALEVPHLEGSTGVGSDASGTRQRGAFKMNVGAKTVG